MMLFLTIISVFVTFFLFLDLYCCAEFPKKKKKKRKKKKEKETTTITTNKQIPTNVGYRCQ